MTLMAEVLDLTRKAGIPDSIVARKLLLVSRATIYDWCKGERHPPPGKVSQILELKKTLKHYMAAGVLPMSREELIWQGLIHVTEFMELGNNGNSTTDGSSSNTDKRE